MDIYWIAMIMDRHGGLFYLCYREFRIGKLDVKNRAITSRKAYLIHGDPRIEEDVFGG